jgi:predicted metal-binding membrane protein
MRLDAIIERAFRSDRTVMALSLAALTALAWLYLIWDASRMAAMPGMASQAVTLSLTTGLMVFAMWAIMMVGMMVPSVAPTILLYANMVRRNREAGKSLPAAWIFTAGYLAAWAGFSLVVTLLQMVLSYFGLISPMMASTSAWLTGGLLVAAGVYQWLPLKDVCLEFCRSPMATLLGRWRPGPSGAFMMGLENGFYCVGCCWALMLLLFAGGVMNLGLVALIAGFVIVEKLFPYGQYTARIAGLVLIAVGLWILVTGGVLA